MRKSDRGTAKSSHASHGGRGGPVGTTKAVERDCQTASDSLGTLARARSVGVRHRTDLKKICAVAPQVAP